MQLNQQAALRAKASASFDGMLNYITEAKGLLVANSWEVNYENTLKTFQILLDAKYLNYDFQTLEESIHEVVNKAQNNESKAEAILFLIKQKISEGKTEKGIEYGYQALDLLEIERPENDIAKIDGYLFQDILPKLKKALDENSIENLPKCNVKHINIAQDIFDLLVPASIQCNDQLALRFVFAKGTELSLKYGNSPASSRTHGAVATFFALAFQDYQSHYKLTELAYELAKKTSKGMGIKNAFTLSNWTAHYKKPLSYGRDLAFNNIQIGLEAGEIEFASYLMMGYIHILFAEGKTFKHIEDVLETHIWDLASKYYVAVSVDAITSIRWVINTLKTDRTSKITIKSDSFEEAEFVDLQVKNNAHFALGVYHIYKTQASYILDNLEEAFKHIKAAETPIPALLTYTSTFDFNFYSSLVHLRKHEETKDESLLEVVNTNQTHMQIWSKSCPENFLHKYQLVEAEKARVTQQNWYEVLEYYEQSIENAKQHGFIQDAALANELCAKYLISIHKKKIAIPYVKEAYNLYKRWGATAKTAQMKTQYAHILAKKKKANLAATYVDYHTISSTTTTKRGLDLDTILKANASLSKQIRLGDLIREMLGLLREATKITFPS